MYRALPEDLWAYDRIRVEEEYIAGLKRIYARSKAVDTLHDEYVSFLVVENDSFGLNDVNGRPGKGCVERLNRTGWIVSRDELD